MVFVLVGVAVLGGAMAQRVSGMGFALVVAPVLVLLLGPFDGVLMVNICGAISSSIIITRVWRYIDWRQYALLIVPALIAIVPGSLVSVALGGPQLQITIGLILVAALAVSLFVTRAAHTTARIPTGVATGFASGFMSATAGISGPAVSIYAVLTRWEQQQFAATLQPYFMTLGASAFVGKIIAAGSFPDYDWWLWALVFACTIIGLIIGGRVAHRVSGSAARTLVILIAFAGAIAAIVDGFVELTT